jgi:hypothetical protein
MLRLERVVALPDPKSCELRVESTVASDSLRQVTGASLNSCDQSTFEYGLIAEYEQTRQADKHTLGRDSLDFRNLAAMVIRMQ